MICLFSVVSTAAADALAIQGMSEGIGSCGIHPMTQNMVAFSIVSTLLM